MMAWRQHVGPNGLRRFVVGDEPEPLGREAIDPDVTSATLEVILADRVDHIDETPGKQGGYEVTMDQSSPRIVTVFVTTWDYQVVLPHSMAGGPARCRWRKSSHDPSSRARR